MDSIQLEFFNYYLQLYHKLYETLFCLDSSAQEQYEHLAALLISATLYAP